MSVTPEHTTPSPTPSRHNRPRARRRAFTLIEATLAIAILSLLMVGMGAALLSTVSAADLGNGPTSQTVASAQALDELRGELASAISIDRRSANGIVFTIADRDGDSRPESIEYSWSGRPADPLLRTINAQPARTVLPAIDALTFSALSQPASIVALTTNAKFAEFNGSTAITAPSDGFRSTLLIAQGWMPGSAATASVGQISKVSFAMRREATSTAPTARLRVFSANSASPTLGRLLGTTTVAASSIATTKTYTLADFAFSSPVEFVSAEGVWMVLDVPGSTGNDFFVAYDSQTTSLNVRGCRAVSGDSGATWDRNAATSYTFKVFGAWKSVTFPQEQLN